MNQAGPSLRRRLGPSIARNDAQERIAGIEEARTEPGCLRVWHDADSRKEKRAAIQSISASAGSI